MIPIRSKISRGGAALAGFVGVALLSPSLTLAAPARTPEVQFIDVTSREVVDSFQPFGKAYDGGLAIAVGDFNGDGIEESVVAQSGGPDAHGRIRLFDSTNTLQAETLITSKAFKREEISLAAGDVDGDGKDELVVSVPTLSASAVVILNEELQLDADTAGLFLAFPKKEHGVSVAVGNVLGSEKEEIIVASGVGGEPRIKILDQNGRSVAPEIIPFASEQTTGLQVATANTTGGEHDDLLVGLLNGAQTWVKHYDIDPEGTYPVRAEFKAWTREYYSGVSLAGVDTDGDGTEEIAVTALGDQQTEVRWFGGDGTPLDLDTLWAFEEDFRGGASIVGTGTKKKSVIAIVPRHQKRMAPKEQREKYGDRWIEVNLSEQREVLWEDGYIRNTYLVSTGLPGTATPPGEFEITRKIASHVYDGEDYFYPNTPWNLRFIEGGAGRNFYFHTAYWHNNFGTPQSHGCVNMRLEDAAFLYQWADSGTKVWIHY